MGMVPTYDVRSTASICCCFSHSAHWLPTRKKLLHTVANPARGLLNREIKKKVWQRPPPPPPPRAVRSEKKKKKKITRRIHMSRRYASRRYAGGFGTLLYLRVLLCHETSVDVSCVPSHATLPNIRPSCHLFKTPSPSLWRECTINNMAF